MRSFALFSILLAALSIGLAQAFFAETCTAEICGEPFIPVQLPAFRRRAGTTTTTARRRHITNAQRLSRGLPPLPPTRRAESCLITSPATPQASPVPPTTYSGIIQVKKIVDGVPSDSLGYLSATPNSGGMFTYVASIGSALLVSFNLDSSATTGTAIPLTMSNSAGPLLGFAQGRDSTSSDISSGSFNYLYLDGIGLPGTGAGCAPSILPTNYSPSPNRAAESSLWNIDLSTGALTAHWVNSDLSTPTTELWLQSGYVYAGGSMAAFLSRYPSPGTAIAFFFVAM